MPDRRTFLKQIAAAAAGTLACGAADARAERLQVSPDQYGVLVDTTRCVGCRNCEKACNEINRDLPRRNPEFFKDDGVFKERRRMDYGAYTVVNQYQNPRDPVRPVYAKFQCMHCLYPACVSACIVGAFSRDKTGAVIYDAWKCIGCRYCMAACPFQVPAYEYKNTFTPQVRKCTLCFADRLSKGAMPACVQSCPMQVMTFGKRPQLLALAQDLITKNPQRYVSHVYGEHEVGGTAWLYLSSAPFQQIDFPSLGYHPAPGYTEPIQHAIFKWFLPPLALYGTLGGIWRYLHVRREKREREEQLACARKSGSDKMGGTL